MSGLLGSLVDVGALTDADVAAMYALMVASYENTCPTVFEKDLADKDACIVLRDPDGAIQGFSTQKLMVVEAGGAPVHGVFSGDTVIAREHWGSPELFRVFARHFIGEQRPCPELYWFLISKGYKTYRMLPVFFLTFYPRSGTPTPTREHHIMDAYALARYPDEYDPARGLVAYHGVKDRLRPGVADVTERCLRDPHVRYFVQRNPGHTAGVDLVCLARLAPDNLRPACRPRLLGGG